MGTIYTNKSAAKHCVIFNKHQEETPLDVLEKFRNWTKEKNIKNYIEIGKMLGVEPNKANRLLSRAALPDKAVCHRMKEFMYDGENHI
ncbi:hypothetical protein Si082_01438 [Streptococcus infantarius subsp. infantarius]|nr:hypothetical protein [Streptococcus infantarius subsp. infantarius]